MVGNDTYMNDCVSTMDCFNEASPRAVFTASDIRMEMYDELERTLAEVVMI
jgi:hypothetical protein